MPNTTDPAEQAYTLKELDKKLAMNAILVAISTILIVGMLSAVWFFDGTLTLVLIEGLAIQQSILTIFFGYLAYTSLQAAISIRMLRKNLIEGKPIDHHAPWKKHYRLNATIALFFTVVVGLNAIFPIVQLVKDETKTLPDTTPDLPIVRLVDVEQNPDLVRGKTTYMRAHVDWDNRYSYAWSPLAPVQYETDETGIVPGKKWGNKSAEYSPSIHTKVYQLSIPAMANRLISNLIKRYKYEKSDDDFIEMNHQGLDRLIIHENEISKEVFASKGKAVMYVRYYGNANIHSVIKNIVEKIDLISQ